MKDPVDVLVIGSGLSGRLTAWWLAKKGLKVQILAPRGFKSHTQFEESQPHIDDWEESMPSETISLRAWEAFSTKWPEIKKSIREQIIQETSLESHELTPLNLYENLQHLIEMSPNIEIKQHHSAIELMTLEKHSQKKSDGFKNPTCIGAYILNHKDLSVTPTLARETVLAAGGFTRSFTGTGIFLAQGIQTRIYHCSHEEGPFPVGGVVADKNGLSSVQQLRVVGSAAFTGVRSSKASSAHQFAELITWSIATAENIVKQTQRFMYNFPSIRASTQGSQQVPTELVQAERELLRFIMKSYVCGQKEGPFFQIAFEHVKTVYDRWCGPIQEYQTTPELFYLRCALCMTYQILEGKLQSQTSLKKGTPKAATSPV